MLHDVINKMIDLSAKSHFADEIMLANQEYFARTGRVAEQEPSYEARVSLFLEWFLFERSLAKEGVTPLSYYGERPGPDFSEAETKIIRDIQSFQHSIYECLKVKGEMVWVRDLADGKKVEVFEGRGTGGFFKGAVFEARLLPFEGVLHFSGHLLFHPPASKRVIRKFLQTNGHLSHLQKVLLLSELCLKFERYKHVAPEKIYNLSLQEESCQKEQT